MIKTILLSTLILNMGLLLGRLAGFFRESIVASTYGTSSQADILVLMLTVPDLLVNILVAGAMGAVLIPEFSSNPNSAKKLLFQAGLFFGLIFIMVSAFLYWQSYALVELLAPGFDDRKKLQASIGLGWVIWLVPLTVLTGTVTAYLHSQNKFAIASLGTLIINVSIITGLFLVQFGFGSIALVAFFVLLGGVLRLFSQLFSVGFEWGPLGSSHSMLLSKNFFIRYGQALLSGSIFLLIPVLARAFSSHLGEGSVALMNYSTRLIEFPLAIAITVFTATLFPRLSESFINNKRLYNQLVMYGAQAILGISTLIMIALILQRDHYVDIVYNYGYMNNEGILTIKMLISIGLISLPLQGVSLFFTSVFHAQKNTKTPFFINSMGLFSFIIIYINDVFGKDIESIMWGVVCSYAGTFILQLWFLKVDGLRVWNVLLKIEFIMGLILSSFFLYLVTSWASYLNINNVTALLISALAGFISLCILALFNKKLRILIKSKVF